MQKVSPQRVLIVRPGLIVGPYDYTDRFTYWVERVARGGEVLASGRLISSTGEAFAEPEGIFVKVSVQRFRKF